MNAAPRTLQVNVGELRSNLANCVDEAEAGARMTITSRGKVVTRLVPVEELSLAERRKPAFGAMKGEIWMTPDAGEPDQDTLDSIEPDIFAPR